MKKVFLLMLLLFSSLSMHTVVNAAVEADTLVVHYYRYDDNYTGYNIWLWPYEPVSSGGIQHDFDNNQKDEKGAYIEIPLDPAYSDSTKVGIIVKQGGWDGYREPGGDRYIDLANAEVIEGKIHAYIVEQDLNIGTSAADLAENKPDYRPRVLNASFNTNGSIGVSLTHVPEVGYTVYENDTIVKTGTSTAKNFTIDMPTVDISKNYTLHVEFTKGQIASQNVSIQKLYDTNQFVSAYTYEGELGVIFSETETTFRLWAPLSEAVTLNLYNQNHPYYNNLGQASEELLPYQTIELDKIGQGAWETVISGDLSGKYYTYTVTNNGVSNEVTDPYAYSTGANGRRGLIVNFDEANPSGWVYGDRPNNVETFTDYIVYELHVRDLTVHESWNGRDEYRGKFMGITQSGTRYEDDGVVVTTGLDHMVELGVNAVQLLPIFDFGYVDEVEVANNPKYTNVFNWGYMPYHFNTLEGSYSTNPFDGLTRVNEFKQAVMALHNNDLRVIMDVVYNHTGESESSNFHKIIPGYYHRMNATGGFSNGSGTGNETASERSMVRKFMVDSVKFWATEYNLSGFRFDLMALHDYQTMNDIKEMLAEIDPTIVVYGEPWNGGSTPLSSSIAADKGNIKNMPEVGAFNDVTRDAVKGSVFTSSEGGWIQGNTSDYNVQSIKYGIMGGVDQGLSQVDEWHLEPIRTINYVSAHDNNTLYDKIRLTGVKSRDAAALQIQANSIILTSQGIPFLHAGVEFMRSKPLEGGGYDHNSYESPDSVNQLRWDKKLDNLAVFEYYKDLIQIRKNYQSFRMDNSLQITNAITFLDTDQGNKAIAFKIAGDAINPEIIVIHSANPGSGLTMVSLPEGKTYQILTTFEQSNPNGIEEVSGTAFVLANTSMILVEKVDEPITIKKPLVKTSNGLNFDPASNVTVNDTNADIFYSSFHETEVPGFYAVTVAVRAEYGKVSYYSYMLQVTGNRFEVNLGGN